MDPARPGDAIAVRGGTYALTDNITITTSGTASQPTSLGAYQGERVVVDGEQLPASHIPVGGSIPRAVVPVGGRGHGLGATAIVGRETIAQTDHKGDAAVRLLANALGGGILTALPSCLAFVTLLAVAAGLTLAAASSLAHDLYGEVIRKGGASETEELMVARLSAAVIGVLAMMPALVSWGANTATLAFLAFAIAASAILPTIVYTLFWRRFTGQGALLSLWGGLVCSVLLVLFSPVVSSTPDSFCPELDFAWFPLQNPGIVSIPAGFFLGWLGTVLSGRQEPQEAVVYEEFEVRMLAGAKE